MKKKDNNRTSPNWLAAKAALGVLLCFSALSGIAQTNFHKLFNVGGGALAGAAMTTTPDGAGVVSFLRSGGSAFMLGVVKIGPNGSKLWAREIAQTSNTISPVSMVAMRDSGVVIGLLDPVQMNGIEIMKLDKAGNLQWAKSFPAVYYVDYPFPIFALADGSILIAHSNTDSLCLKKVSPIGQLVWSKSYGSPGTGIIRPSAVVAEQSSIYVGGHDGKSYSAFLMKTDGSGNINWQKRNAGAFSSSLNILPVETGGIIISTVYLNPTPAESRVAFIRPDGTINWAIQSPFVQPQMFPIGPNAFGLAMKQNSIVKVAILDTFGTLKSARSYHDSIVHDDHVTAGDPGRGFWVAGPSANSVWMMRADTSGNSGCFTQTVALAIQNQVIQPLNFNLVGNAGTTTFVSSMYASQPMTVSESGICSTTTVSEIEQPEVLCYPNPFSGELMIKQPEGAIYDHYRVLSPNGRVVAEGVFAKNESVVTSAMWPAGIYFVIATDAYGNQRSFKILKR